VTHKLRVVPTLGSQFEYQLQPGETLIGRSLDSDLVIRDRALSRKHAKLYYRNKKLLLEDLGSHNGTWIEGQRIQKPIELRSGTVFKVAENLIRVERDSSVMETRDPGETTQTGSSLFLNAADLLANQEVATVEDGRLPQFMERLRIVNEVHRALGGSISLDDLFELIMERIFDLLKCEEVTIFLRDEQDRLKPVASKSVSGRSERMFYSKQLIQEVLHKGMAALVHDAAIDERFNSSQSIIASGVRSILAAPLPGTDDGDTLGLIVLNSQVRVRQFSEADLELLVTLASIAALRIRNLQLGLHLVEQRRLEREVEIAREIQIRLISDKLPQHPHYDMFAVNQPSSGVSGDYYEAVERPDGQIVLLVADVSGKGIAASLLTASLEALFAAPIEDMLPPHHVCEKVSRLMWRRTPRARYATAFMGLLNPDQDIFEYANAGHNPPLILRQNGEMGTLERTGTPIGMLPKCKYIPQSLKLASGDLILMFTDGITEAQNPEGEEYGTERLENLVRRMAHAPLEHMCREIERDVLRFTDGAALSDDRTLFVLRRR
jgi:serine phosphatase RsbU (regulator of sigma subunit)